MPAASSRPRTCSMHARLVPRRVRRVEPDQLAQQLDDVGSRSQLLQRGRAAGRPRRRCCSGRTRRGRRRPRCRARAASSPRPRSSRRPRPRSRARRALRRPRAARAPSTVNANVGTRPSIVGESVQRAARRGGRRGSAARARVSCAWIAAQPSESMYSTRGDEAGEQLVRERARLEARAERLRRRGPHLVRPPRARAAPRGRTRARGAGRRTCTASRASTSTPRSTTSIGPCGA